MTAINNRGKPTAPLPASGARHDRPDQSGGAGMRRHPWIILGTVIVLVLALAGVGIWYEVSREIGRGPNAFLLASGSLKPGHMTEQYHTFSGLAREKTNVTAGQTIQLRYTLHATKGSLAVAVLDPVGNHLWSVTVPQQQDRRGTARITASRTGAYQVVVIGLDTGGRFDVSWAAS